MKAFIALCCSFLLSSCLLVSRLNAQFSQNNLSSDKSLPEVFMLGEKSHEYEKTMSSYQTLLDACNGDMNVAFQKLYGMMKEMEAYAGLVEYDLDGINAWMHFFWKKDGSIEHIGFHLKPNSRNVNIEAFKLFLKNFSTQYKFPLQAADQYAHYSTFSFPVN